MFNTGNTVPFVGGLLGALGGGSCFSLFQAPSLAVVAGTESEVFSG